MRQKINIKQLDKQVIEYFNLKQNLTNENFLHIIVKKAGPVIQNWVKFKYTSYQNNSEKSDEIINIVYSKLIESCIVFDGTRGIPFTSYFYKNIKVIILGEFGKITARQHNFENKLTWFSESALETIMNLDQYNDQKVNSEVFKKDFQDFLNTLEKSELLYLKNKSNPVNYYSTTRANMILKSLKNKAQNFFQ